jgi:HlyD family secretion protein
MDTSHRHRLLLALLGLAVLAALYLASSALGLGWLQREAPSNTVLLSGNVEAHESQLSFKGVQSRVVELPFDEGQAVRRGTVLARVDSQDLGQQVTIADSAVVVQQRQLAAAQQNLEAARRVVEADRASLAQRELDLRRAQDLQRQGFVAEAALDNARTALAETRAQLARDEALAQAAARNIAVLQASAHSAEETARLSRIQAAYATLVAPFDGVILARQAELGEVVAPGTPIVTVADLDHVWVRAYLNEPDLRRVRLGEAATVSTDALHDKPLHGRLAFIASEAEFTPKSVETHAERVTLVYRVKIDVDNQDHGLLPGMPVDVRLAAVAP